jgi:hypothetical protein
MFRISMFLIINMAEIFFRIWRLSVKFTLNISNVSNSFIPCLLISGDISTYFKPNRPFSTLQCHYVLIWLPSTISVDFNVFQHLDVISTFLSIDIWIHFNLYIFQSSIFQYYSYSKNYFIFFQNANAYLNIISILFQNENSYFNIY